MTRQSRPYTNETSFEWDENEEPYYTTVDNYICDNDNIEYNSQGMYLQIIKYKNSPTHKVYMSSLENKKGSRRDVQRAMLNLRVEGFIFRELKREDGKLQGYTYKIRRKPIQITDDMLLDIFNESKINREYILKIYGKEFYNRLEELNKINESTENSICVTDKILEKDDADCTNCVATKSVSTKRVAKKENNLKTKIDKKENKTTTIKSDVCDDENIICNLIKIYIDNYGKKPYSKTIDRLLFWENAMDIECVKYAIEKASSVGQGFNYADGILRNWKNRDGFNTIDDVIDGEISES